jgi:hypothetical protein
MENIIRTEKRHGYQLWIIDRDERHYIKIQKTGKVAKYRELLPPAAAIMSEMDAVDFVIFGLESLGTDLSSDNYSIFAEDL